MSTQTVSFSSGAILRIAPTNIPQSARGLAEAYGAEVASSQDPEPQASQERRPEELDIALKRDNTSKARDHRGWPVMSK
jgi:hypothetical protein